MAASLSFDAVYRLLKREPPSPIYYVTGVLTARDTLELPGGSFRSHERARVAQWIAKLRADDFIGVIRPAA